jgi:formylglycine-generating enzyme required for sulfatase activity
MAGHATAFVGRLFDRLKEQFGEKNVFMDIDTMPPGVRFDEYIGAAVSKADIFLAVIGNQWLEQMQARHGEDNDYVRLEIEAALKRSIPVVPLLIGNTKMPGARDLPPSLSHLALRNAYPLDSERDFNPHVTRLISELERLPLPPREDGTSIRVPEAVFITKGASPWSVLFVAALAAFGGSMVGVHQPWTMLGPRPVPVDPLPPPTNFTNKVGMDMIWCPPGTFMMGSPASEPGHQPDEIQHLVHLTSGFWMARTEVTNEQWKTVMTRADKDEVDTEGHDQKPSLPKLEVTWDDAVEFCWKLTEIEHTAGTLPPDEIYALPTEAQWEFACRAGSAGPYNLSGVELISDSNGLRFKVGKEEGHLPPNAWGLAEMHDSTAEWCRDFYAPYKDLLVTNPVFLDGDAFWLVETSSSDRFLSNAISPRCVRGGIVTTSGAFHGYQYSSDGWWGYGSNSYGGYHLGQSYRDDARSANRAFAKPDRAFPDIGFRPVRISTN